jgi:hypothetical protein
MSTAHILGFPRIGAHRELKFALERYWREGPTADGPSRAARNWPLAACRALARTA